MPLRSHIFDLNDLHTPKRVTNTNQLKDELNGAGPGDVIELDDGNYNLDNFTMKRSGTEGLPIVIRAREARNGAVIQGNSEFTLSGNWVYIEGLRFEKLCLLLKHDGRGGGKCRITRCKFVSGNRPGGVVELQDTSENRIDHCEFDDAKRRGLCLQPVNPQDDHAAVRDKRMQFNLIDHNYFHDFDFVEGNGREPMNIGRGPEDSLVPCFTTVEYNLFENVLGDEETISVKSSDNTIQFNTFKRNFQDSDDRDKRRYGQVNLRHGNRNSVLGNTLIDMALINVRGDDHRVLGNRMVTRNSNRNRLSNIRVCKGNVLNAPGSWQGGQSGKGRHPSACRCIVAGNVIDRDLEIGESGGTGSSGGGALDKPAEDTILQDNQIGGNHGKPKLGLETGTKLSGFSGPIPTAVELTAAQVGVNAPDPREPRNAATITQTLSDGDTVGPGEFEWLATISPADDSAVVQFFVDDEEVNDESSPPYGDRRNNHEEYFQWKDTARYGAGTYRMTVRNKANGLENAVTVNMITSATDANT